MKPLLSMVLFFVALAAAFGREGYRTRFEYKIDPDKQTRLQREVRTYMDAVIFPKVSLSGMPFAKAVPWVQQHISEHAPASVPFDRRGISIFLRTRQKLREPVRVALRAATLPEVLDAICSQHHYLWCLEPYALSIAPREDFPFGGRVPRLTKVHVLRLADAAARRSGYDLHRFRRRTPEFSFAVHRRDWIVFYDGKPDDQGMNFLGNNFWVRVGDGDGQTSVCSGR